MSVAPSTSDRGASGAQRAFTERVRGSLGRRRVVSMLMGGLTVMSAIIATLPLILILWHVAVEGFPALSVEFFTQVPRPAGEEGGGMAHAIVGTLVLIATASAIGLPIGIGAGLYLAERKAGALPTTVRFLADVLNGMPSIVMGIFAWTFLVKPFQRGSALAGAFALAAIMIPLVTRTTEEMIRTVPTSLREAALALGYTRWRTSLTIVLRTALAGIITGVLVAVARIAGETAPLMFTVFGRGYVSTSLTEQIHALPLQIFQYANISYEHWRRLAWGGALILVALIFVLSVVARVVTRARFRGGSD